MPPATSDREKLLPEIAPEELQRLLTGRHHDPHALLGAHPAGDREIIIRAWHPEAVSCELLLTGRGDGPREMTRIAEPGLFAVRLKSAFPAPADYRLRFHFADNRSWECHDPYIFPPGLGELDLHLIAEGRHRQLFNHLGAHPQKRCGLDGVAFALWAPNAERVSVVGDFNHWNGLRHPMRVLGGSGIWELFIPGLESGTIYKYEIRTRGGDLRLKTDPLAFRMELRPQNASLVFDQDGFDWQDEAWQETRADRQTAGTPMAVYEVHLGSWRPPADGRRPGYREIAPELVAHVKELGFTHIELLPVSEHPFDGSWGYQVSGYYAPTSRYGTPDDFKFFVDYCHRHEIGVILDWVPAHFPKDDFSLRLFDGTALYEHADPRRGEHPDWGTLIFNYGRPEVANFLAANAFFWFERYHIDGLRVDAVASMLYLDYSRKEGEWLPNIFGGRENLEAITFIKELNREIKELYPGRLMIAEESTSWPGVTRPPELGGLGFDYKWNMGWMNDTLEYFRIDPLFRTYHHNQITFSLIYAFSERFLLPFSHDEVVHGKGSLFNKMPGDDWQKFAGLRLLLGYQFTHPGKKLLFMGSELAPTREWDHAGGLDWEVLEKDERRQKFFSFCRDLVQLYRRRPALWRRDHEEGGFAWIDCHDHVNSVLVYRRLGRPGEELVCIVNLTPTTHFDYRIGLPQKGGWREIFNSDAGLYGGSNQGNLGRIEARSEAFHGLPASALLTLPPLALLVLEKEPEE
jgi:1,4-alpha-glucan branching enzyme